MLKCEKKIIDFLIKHKNALFFATITILSFAARFYYYPNIEGDIKAFLIPWYEKFSELGGLEGLKYNIGDYNLLYQTIVAFLAELNVGTGMYVLLIKVLSTIFDYAIAIGVAGILKHEYEKDGTFFCLVYAILAFIPTNVLNASAWGQCDSIYVFFIIMCLKCMYRESYKKAFAYYGLALAFKFQAVFILPFILTYYIYKKSFSILNFLISIGVFWGSGIVAYLYGKSVFAPFAIYLRQTNSYPDMWLSYPSFWVFFGNYYNLLKSFAIFLTIAVLGIGFYWCISGRKKIDTFEDYIATATWFVWTCLFFLPCMHERYGYLLDVLLIMLCFANAKYIKYFLVSNIIATITYSKFLFGYEFEITIPVAVIVLVSYALFTYNTFRCTEKSQCLSKGADCSDENIV